jgi:hypothetical protein
MKNANHLLRHLVIMTVLAVSLVNCKNQEKQGPQNEESPKPEEAPAKLIQAPEHIISLEEAESIYNNYSTHRATLIQNYETKQRAPEQNFEVARFVDFDYDTIKQYLAYVEQESQKAGVKEITKLRIYFANYPDEKTFADGKEVVHPRQNTVFLVPTLDKGGENYAFYIGGDGKPKLIIDRKRDGMGSLNENSTKSYASLVPSFWLNSNLYNGTSLTLNRSGSGPPPHSDF